jgi:hypothetical protein
MMQLCHTPLPLKMTEEKLTLILMLLLMLLITQVIILQPTMTFFQLTS